MKHIFFLFAVLAAIVSLHANAQTTFYWHPTSGTNWNTLANWTTGTFGGTTATVLPGRADSVTIGNSSTSYTVVLNVSDTIKSLTIEGSGQIFINTSNSSVLYLLGNLTSTNSNGTGGGTATIKLCGSVTQKITGGSIDGDGKLPNLTIANSNSVKFYNIITMGGSTTLTYTSGTVAYDPSSHVTFYYNNTISGNIGLDTVEFQGNGGTFTVSNTLTVNGNLKLSGSGGCVLNTGTINLYGNLIDLNSSTSSAGSAHIVMVNSIAQYYTFTSGPLCNFSVNQGSGGSVSAVSGTSTFAVASFTLTAGTFNAPTKGNLKIGITSVANATPTSIFTQSGGTFNADSGTVTFNPYGGSSLLYYVAVLHTTLFYNVTVNLLLSSGYPNNIAVTGDSMRISGTLTHTLGALVGSPWLVTGNLVVGSTANWGDAPVMMTGSANATYSYTGTNANGTALICVSKTSGASVSAATGTTAFSVTAFELTSGIFNAPNKGTLYIGSTYFANLTPTSIFTQSGGTFNADSGTVTFNPYGSSQLYDVAVLHATVFYNVTVNLLLSSGYPNNIAVTGDSMRISGTLTHTLGALVGNPWLVTGNLVVGSTANWGDASVMMIGSANATYSYTGTNANGTALICVSKTGGASVSAATGTTAFSVTSFTLTAGTFNAPSKGTLYIGSTYFANLTPTSIFTQSGGTFNADSGTVTFNPYGGSSLLYYVAVLHTTLFYNITVNLLLSSGYPNNIAVTGDSMRISGTLTHTLGALVGNPWLVTGNLVVGSTANWGNAPVMMTGSANATYSYTGTNANGTALICVSKTGGASVSAATGTTVFSVTSFTLTTGTFNVPSKGSLYIGSTYFANLTPTTIFTQSGGTFNADSGTVTFNPYGGSQSYTVATLTATVFYNVTVNLLTTGVANTLTITTGDSLKVGGSLTLTKGYVNNYPMMVQGNVTVSSTFNGGSAPLIFTGGNSQTFNLTGATSSFGGKLYVNKSSGNVTLSSALTMSASGQTLTLIKGNIITTSSNLLTIGNGVTVSGASNNSFVSGPVEKIGNAAFRFPIGAGSVYNPVAISAPSSTSDAFTAQYYNSASSYTSLDGVLTYVDPCEYWNLTHTTGSSSVHDTLFWNSPCFHIASLSYFKIGYVSGSTWTSAGTCTTSGTTTTGAIASPAGTTGNISLAKTNTLITITTTNTTICNGASTSLGSDVSVSGGTGTLTYAWSPATGLSNSTAANPTATPTATTTYSVTVTDAITESLSATVVITVNPLPGNNAGTNQTICNGNSTSVGASNTSGHTYSWSPATALSSSTISNPTASPTATTTYTLTETITATSCSISDGVTVTVNPLPGNNTGSNHTICNGSGTTIGASSTSGHTYSWSPATALSSSTISNPTASPTTITTYTLTETITATGCSVSNSIAVTVNPLPGNNAGSNVPICNGNSTTIGETSTSGHTYSWSPSTGLSGSTVSNPTASPTVTTTYTLTETITATSCSVSNNIVVSVKTNPVAHAGENFTTFTGYVTTLGADTTATGGTSPYSYLWSPGVSLDDSTSSNPTVALSTGESFNLSVTDANGCNASGYITILTANPASCTSATCNSNISNFITNPGFESENFSDPNQLTFGDGFTWTDFQVGTSGIINVGYTGCWQATSDLVCGGILQLLGSLPGPVQIFDSRYTLSSPTCVCNNGATHVCGLAIPYNSNSYDDISNNIYSVGIRNTGNVYALVGGDNLGAIVNPLGGTLEQKTYLLEFYTAIDDCHTFSNDGTCGISLQSTLNFHIGNTFGPPHYEVCLIDNQPINYQVDPNALCFNNMSGLDLGTPNYTGVWQQQWVVLDLRGDPNYNQYTYLSIVSSASFYDDFRLAPLADAGPDQTWCGSMHAQIGPCDPFVADLSVNNHFNPYCEQAGTTNAPNSANSITYSWSPSTYLSCSSCSNPFVNIINNTSSDITVTYTLTVNVSIPDPSNNGDYISISSPPTSTVTVTVHPRVRISVKGGIAPLNFCAIGDTISVTSPSSSYTGYTYTWEEISDGSTVASGSGTSVTIADLTTTSDVALVIFTGTEAGCTSSDTVTIYPCCQGSGTDITVSSTTATLKEFLSSYSSYFTGSGTWNSPYKSTHVFYFNNNMAIDTSNITFENCTFKYGTDVRWALNGSTNLNFKLCLLTNACPGNMWDGIYDTILPVPLYYTPSNIILLGDSIEQSANGIVSKWGNPIDAVYNKFINCFRGIQISNDIDKIEPFGTTLSGPPANFFLIEGNLFEATSPYCVYSPLISMSATINTSGDRAQFGISVQNSPANLIIDATYLPTGNSVDYDPNTFKYINCGIYVNNSNVDCDYNYFQNIANYDYNGSFAVPPYIGSAFYASGTGTEYVLGTGAIIDFDNCTTGVNIQGPNAYIRYNNMDSMIHGVILGAMHSSNYYVEHNRMSIWSQGINSASPDKNSSLYIRYNHIKVNDVAPPRSFSSPRGIAFEHSGIALKNNYVSYDTISVSSASGSSANEGAIILYSLDGGYIENDSITLNGAARFGIVSYESRKVTIQSNLVNGSYTTPPSDAFHGIAYYEEGNNSNLLCSNGSNNTYTGFQTQSGESKMSFTENSIGSHYYAGLFFDAYSDNIGPIGHEIGADWYSLVNTWQTTASDYTNYSAYGIYKKGPYNVYVRNPPENTVPPAQSGTNAILRGVNFNQIAVGDYGCGAAPIHYPPLGLIPKGLYSDSTSAEVTMNYQARRYLFEQLQDSGYTVSGGSTDTLQHFFDTASVSNIGAFEAIEDSINAIALAGSYADSISLIEQKIDSLNFLIDSITTYLDTLSSTLSDSVLTGTSNTDSILIEGDAAQIESLDSVLSSLLTAQRTSYMERLSSLATLNSTITTSETYEINEKSVNDIYIRNFMETDFLNVSTTDMSTLWTIANQCPYVGGIACLRARGILASLIDSAYWNDDSLCGYSDARMEVRNPSPVPVPYVHLYPNPTSNSVNIVVGNESANGTIAVFDLMGELLLKETLGQSNGIFTLSTSNLNSGNYLIEYTNGKEHWVEKLAVIH